MRAGFVPGEIRELAPDLEDVFLRLTGPTGDGADGQFPQSRPSQGGAR